MPDRVQRDYRFVARQSADDLKRDLELTCTDCGGVVCDIEDGDNLWTLIETSVDHTCSVEGD